MKLDFEARRASLSVGEFANFSLGPAAHREHPGGRWRMEVGTQWHQTLQIQLKGLVAQDPGLKAKFEVAIAGELRAEDWNLRLTGRLDQVLETPDEVIFREVKSVRRALPVDEEELRAAYASYFAQLAIYVRLAELVEPWRQQAVRGELVFVDIDDGISQSLPMEAAEARELVDAQKRVLLTFLQARADARHRRRHMEFQPAFRELRPGQQETRERLEFLAARHRLIFFEAPTGYGKTGTLLEYSLERLREGLFDRVLYVTGKSTGQIQVAAQLSAMLGTDAGVRFIQMRSRAEHAIPELPPDYFDRRAQEARWKDARIDPAQLFAGATLPLEAIKRIGRETRIEPYALTRALLPFAEVWIGDYNYVFSPRIRQVFSEVPGFVPEQTLLIVDEAHNLPDRVADGLSAVVHAADAHAVAAHLQILGWPAPFVRSVQNFAAFLDHVPPCEALPDSLQIEGSALLRRVADPISNSPLPWDEVDTFSLEWLWDLPAFARALESSHLEYLSWAPKKGTWSHTCLDAGPEIVPVLDNFGQTVLMSATLQPFSAFKPRLGLRDGRALTSGVELEASAPWREHAYRVAIDVRVDTRYNARHRSYITTAQTIAQATAGQPMPVVAFFSSYAYAERVAAILSELDPFTRVFISPRRMTLSAQEAFIGEALVAAHAIFLVLGTGFTEGIDLLGGRVKRAIVVGPALPEVNAVTRAGLAARESRGRDAAFREVFQIPAMTRINQALGRLVRAPGQSAEVLLHGQRFAESSYQQLLSPAYHTTTLLQTAEQVALWWET